MRTTLLVLGLLLAGAPLAWLVTRHTLLGMLLLRLERQLDALAAVTGRHVMWLSLALVLLQFAIVVLRYAFGVGHVALQEGIIYLHATLFLLAAAYALREDAHVRVDIFYRDAPPRRRAWIDLAGTYLFLIPAMAVVLWVAFPYVAASWAVMEGSKETSGLPFTFLLKTLMLVFAVLVLLQGYAAIIRCIHTLLGGAGGPAGTRA